MTTTTRLLVQAIAPERLARVRAEGKDGHGNQVQAFAAAGQGEPLRCCLRYARPGEQIEPDVATVHVRTLAPQCFLYSVVAG